MPFSPWKCGACEKHGKQRHEKLTPVKTVAVLTALAHRKKSPACHAKHNHKFVTLTWGGPVTKA